jgi:hypothetical protein
MSNWEDQLILDSVPLNIKKVSRGKVSRTSCPSCNDHKDRLYFIWNSKKNVTIAYCHNCSYSKPLKAFIREYYSDIYKQYYSKHRSKVGLIESNIKEVVQREEKRDKVRLIKRRQHPPDCIILCNLYKNHKALKYVKSRKIPESHWKNIYYCSSFKRLASKYGLDVTNWQDDERLVMPFWDNESCIVFIQGRSLDPDTKMRYITIRVKEESLKIWGLDSINISERIYITEGPLDAMFLPNSLAMAGSDIQDKELLSILNVKDPSQIVFVYDNEPDNAEIYSKMVDKVSFGFSIVLWDRKKVKQKDVNDMVLSGFNINNIEDMIFDGIRAKVRLKRWKLNLE